MGSSASQKRLEGIPSVTVTVEAKSVLHILQTITKLLMNMSMFLSKLISMTQTNGNGELKIKEGKS